MTARTGPTTVTPGKVQALIEQVQDMTVEDQLDLVERADALVAFCDWYPHRYVMTRWANLSGRRRFRRVAHIRPQDVLAFVEAHADRFIDVDGIWCAHPYPCDNLADVGSRDGFTCWDHDPGRLG